MKIGIIGLGRMGMNMARRLLKNGHEVVAYNRTFEKTQEIEKEGAIGAQTLDELVNHLSERRIVWIMLPAGNPTDEYVEMLSKILSKGDMIIDGSNGFYKDDLRRAAYLEKSGINYVDAGVSGGIWGLEVGYCTMIGGKLEDFKYIEPILKALAPEEGYMYCGDTGSGHYTKMIHNGIEYALMESYGEGFEILKSSPYGTNLDLNKVAHIWNHGSVIRSWLLELLESAFKEDGTLSNIKGYVDDSGEGRWTVKEAVDLGVSANVIAYSLFKRFESRQDDLFSDKVIAALRKEFGGHKIYKEDDKIDPTGEKDLNM
ncbi:MAG: phosphogluconate dehydrogenase (NAD(+)-dependent, decarboxylating) [Athalassotoga sp.]|uniref:phosphogluconate dehydrogenase (NAD(+)-dependent, decarboxylating) n=1 Tax=Athalassotoga sp. TaxID=2022597 RepID=UPI003CFDB4BA